MDDLAKEYVLSFFSRNLSLHGDRPEAVRWTAQGQREHYEAMLDVAPSLEGAAVLDFGCGKGDFCSFLKERGIPVCYTGMDINAELISMARGKHPDAAFRVFNVGTDGLTEDFDYIFLCGVFNLNFQGIEASLRETVTKLFPHCRKALAVNALSSHNPRREFDLHYTSPSDLFRFAVENISPFVSLRHDRILYDFTLFVYRSLQAVP